MSDPFASLLGYKGQGAVQEIRIGIHQESRARCIAAYQAGIALPEVSVVDHTNPLPIPIPIGQDGKVYDDEKRKELMKRVWEIMTYDEDGKPEFQKAYEVLGIEEERWGESAENARPKIRVVKPKEMDMNPSIHRCY